MHETHDSILEQITPEFLDVSKREGISDPRKAVYISGGFEGSPASLPLTTSHWILEVDGKKVETMSDMEEIISTLKQNCQKEYIVVKTIERRGIMNVVSVRPNPKFWPAWKLESKNEKWVRTELE